MVLAATAIAQTNATPVLEVLTLTKAQELALANNHGIALQKLAVQAAETQVHRGNAGQLPTVTANFSRTYSSNNIRQEFGDPSREPITRAGAGVDVTSGGVALNWTLFDGMGMFVSYERLQQLKKQTEEGARATVEQTMAQVSSSFHTLVLQQERLSILKANEALSAEREALAQQRYEAGTGSKLDWLNAQVDRNEDRAATMAQELLVEQALAALNVVMGRKADARFMVKGDLNVGDSLLLEPLYSALESANPQLVQARLARSVAGMDQQLVNADRYPTLNLNAGYNYSDQNFQAGLFKRNQSYGPTVGISAGMNLYNGGMLNRSAQLAKINTVVAETNEAQLKLLLNGQLYQSYLAYKQNRRLLGMETNNLAIAQQNAGIAMERYKVGLARSIEVREAQQALLNAQARRQDAAFRTKLAEVELARLTGRSTVKAE